MRLPTTSHDVEFDIEFEDVNPDVDKIISDGHAQRRTLSSAKGLV